MELTDHRDRRRLTDGGRNAGILRNRFDAMRVQVIGQAGRLIGTLDRQSQVINLCGVLGVRHHIGQSLSPQCVLWNVVLVTLPDIYPGEDPLVLG